MTKHIYFYAMPLLIATSSLCLAMEKIVHTSDPEIIATFTPIKNPQSIICLNDNVVAISGNNSSNDFPDNCCILWDLSTHKEIIKITDEHPHNKDWHTIAAHPNKKLLALCSAKKLTLYDIENKLSKENRKWEHPLRDGWNGWNGIPVFNPIDDTILVYNNSTHGIDSFNYKNNIITSFSLNSTSYRHKKMAFHPTKQECIITTDTDDILILQPGKNPFIKKEISTKNFYSYVDDCKYSYVDDCKYSPDGSLIALSHSYRSSSILDPSSNSIDKLMINTDELQCAIIFHPTSFIFATLSRQHDTVYYWNAKHNRLITTTPLIHSMNNHYYSRCSFTNCMDFSCNGTQLIVALADKCMILKVPFDVLSKEVYQRGTKKQCIFTTLVLQHYFYDNNNALPSDIKHLIIKYLLAASKF